MGKLLLLWMIDISVTHHFVTLQNVVDLLELFVGETNVDSTEVLLDT